jgi:hypothetical protein
VRAPSSGYDRLITRLLGRDGHTSCAMPSDIVVSHEDLAHVQVVLERILRFTVRLRALQAFQPVPAQSSTEHDECGFSSVAKVASRRRRFVMRVRESRVAHGALRPVCLFIVSRYHVSLMTCLWQSRMIRGCR